MIARDKSLGRNHVNLKLSSLEGSEVYYLDDFSLIYLIENTHKLILSDYAEKRLPEEIGFKLEDITIDKMEKHGRSLHFITGMKKIYPDYPARINPIPMNQSIPEFLAGTFTIVT